MNAADSMYPAPRARKYCRYLRGHSRYTTKYPPKQIASCCHQTQQRRQRNPEWKLMSHCQRSGSGLVAHPFKGEAVRFLVPFRLPTAKLRRPLFSSM